MSGENFLIDTNIIIPFLNGDSSVVKNITSLDYLGLPSVVIGELYFGAFCSAQSEKNIDRISELLVLCQVLDITQNTSLHYGRIKASLKENGTPIPENDIWIAAICIEHKKILITRDQHFNFVPNLKTESW